MSRLPILNIIFLGLITIACSSGRCRERKIGTGTDLSKSTPASEEAAAKTSQTVKVFKADGSKQCKPGTGTDIDTAAKDLSGIKIVSRAKRGDGKMRIQMCGADTGSANVYEIQRADLDAALKRGFQKWTRD